MEDIDVDGLAEAVFQSVGTNTSLLLMDPESEDSIWGSVLLKWGKAINAATRISCRNLWFKNSGNVQSAFNNIFDKEGIPTISKIEEDGSFPMPVVCGCENSPQFISPYGMVLCSTCPRWYHLSCLTNNGLIGIHDGWECPKCQEARYKCQDVFYMAKMPRSYPFQEGLQLTKITGEIDVSSLRVLAPPNSLLKVTKPVIETDMVTYETAEATDTSQDAEGNPPSDEFRYNFHKKVPQKPPKFKVVLPSQIWKTIEPTLQRDSSQQEWYRHQLQKPGWMQHFSAAFKKNVPFQEMKRCLLTFYTHRVSMGVGKKTFVNARALCRRDKSRCNMRYQFVIAGKPEENSDVVVHIFMIGWPDHTPVSLIQPGSSKNQGILEEFASMHESEVLESDPVRYQANLGSAEQVESSETSEVFRHTRQQAASISQNYGSFYTDLMKKKKLLESCDTGTGGIIRGCIQEIGFKPFYVSVYNSQQLNILQRLLTQNNRQSHLFLHATGPVAAKLDAESDVHFYALCARLPDSENLEAVPILEIISGDRTSTTLSYALHSFFNKYAAFCGGNSVVSSIHQITSVFSPALISGVLKGQQFASTAQYLCYTWFSVLEQIPIRFVHQICKGHVLQILHTTIEDHFEDRLASQELVKMWAEKLLACQDLWDYCRLVENIILICGRPYLSVEARACIRSLHNLTAKTSDPPHSRLLMRDLPVTGELYAMSPYSNFAVKFCFFYGVELPQIVYDNVGLSECQLNNKTSADDEDNPHYSVAFLQSLVEDIFPYQCMIDNSLLSLMNWPVEDLSNSTVESWDAIIKKHERKCKLMKNQHIDEVVHDIYDSTQVEISKFVRALTQFEIKFNSEANRTETQEKPRCRPRKAEDGQETPNMTTGPPNSEITRSENRNKKRRQDENSDSQFEKKQISKPPISATPAGIFMEEIRVVPQGGSLILHSKSHSLKNTCWADSSLQGIHTTVKADAASNVYLEQLASRDEQFAHLVDALRCIDHGLYNEAKQIFFVRFLGGYRFRINHETQVIDVFDAQDAFFSGIKHLYSLRQTYKCDLPGCNVPYETIIYPLVDPGCFNISVGSSPSWNNVLCPEVKKDMCDGICGTNSRPTVSLSWGPEGAPPFLILPVPQGVVAIEQDAPSSVVILGQRYKLLLFTKHRSADQHFYNVMLHDGERYIFDGLRPQGCISQHTNSLSGDHINCFWFVKQY